MQKVDKVSLNFRENIHQALIILQESAMRLVLIVDDQKKLMGVVSDGDIRRAILSNIALTHPVTEIMNAKPVTVKTGTPKEKVLQLFRDKGIARIPMVNDAGQVEEVLALETLFNIETHKNPVIIMAGGLGSRLSPLTDETPKPMLTVGGKPILETILINCIEQGFSNFYFSVNYKSEQIKDYFKDGSKWGVKIQYLEEKTRLGTAGSLKLLTEKTTLPVIVMNGDLLTKINLCSLLDYHHDSKSFGTMCVKEYDFQIPYGVVKEKDGQIIALEEKPVHSFLVNAGIYALSPEIIGHIPEGEYFDMTHLFVLLRTMEKNTMVFPIHEYWLDIGKMQDYEKAQVEFHKKF